MERGWGREVKGEREGKSEGGGREGRRREEREREREREGGRHINHFYYLLQDCIQLSSVTCS